MQRLTESKPGLILGILLAVMWIASMSIADSSPCTLPPLLWGLALVVLAALVCLAIGYKVVRLPFTAWLSLAAGGYFLARALTGFSVTDNWSDTGLILGAFVFYLAGVYSGQQNNSRGTAIVLSLAILLNIFYMWLLQDESISLNWAGRADIGLAGPCSRNTSLFVYKNFAGLFFTLAGALLLWRVVLSETKGLKIILPLLIGAGSIAASFFCGTRQIWVVLPLTLLIGWILWLIVGLYAAKPLHWGILAGGISFLIGGAICVYDFLFGHSISEQIFSINTHLRAGIWDYICDVAHKAPLYGYGPAGSTWEIVHFYNQGALPNYAHNEYVQAWADYGIIGLGLMLGILILHLIEGFRALASDTLPHARRVKVVLALICLLTISVSAAGDYVWHSFALVSMTAFACGTLASPYARPRLRLFDRRNWAPGHAPALNPVRAETRCGKALVLALGLVLLTALGKLGNTLTPFWQAERHFDRMIAAGATPEQQRDHLMSVILSYPDSRIADYYVLLAQTTEPDWSMYTEEQLRELKLNNLISHIPEPDWKAYERGLRATLAANPRQLCIAATLAQLLSKQSRFEEAEQLFRNHYPGDGPDNKALASWGTFYAAHLQRWGQHLLSTPDGTEKAYSMLTYAANIAKKTGYVVGRHFRRDRTCNITRLQAFQRGYARDLQVLRYIDPPKDDSWMQPLTQGGKPALYQRYQKTAK
ncbi:MAG: O-antigen ligase family protein [Akkermansia sp.]|nr:O-antigen ligase family protein [Akkermansia sp.]